MIEKAINALVFALTYTLAVTAIDLAILALSARAVCRAKGHNWKPEVNHLTGERDYRCQRCRRWPGA